jgi:50S ribosomal subunit-associated GTPase HflX
LLKDKLKTIDKQMATQRNNRGKVVRAALVGYTNVGKSTLMNPFQNLKFLQKINCLQPWILP